MKFTGWKQRTHLQICYCVHVYINYVYLSVIALWTYKVQFSKFPDSLIKIKINFQDQINKNVRSVEAVSSLPTTMLFIASGRNCPSASDSQLGKILIRALWPEMFPQAFSCIYSSIIISSFSDLEEFVSPLNINYLCLYHASWLNVL